MQNPSYTSACLLCNRNFLNEVTLSVSSSLIAKATNRPTMTDGSIEIRPEDLDDGEDPMAPLCKTAIFNGTKATVGLSRINRTECDMACDLAQFLVKY